MKLQKQTNKRFRGDNEPMTLAAARTALKGRAIAAVSVAEGRPAGPNNDCLTLRLDDGSKLQVDAYSGGDIYVTLEPRP
jgi:hypothetical protein